MSFDKAIGRGKENRKPYRKAKAKDPSCRNHGSCQCCIVNRTHKSIRTNEAGKQALKEFLEECNEKEH